MQASRFLRPLAVAATIFGLVTVFSGGRALFGGAEARAAVGNAVELVLWFNFLAGFAYVLAGIGLWQQRRWALPVSAAVAIGTGVVAIAFAVQVISGAAFEMRTVWALVLRLGFWLVVTMLALRVHRQRR